ncbi:zinc-binding dehydrogenase [Paracoccus aestuariivivens]|uniref:enoyl-[acyl-carrier-protein] reductase n=1 Tax=Paracoccus aestuariivivens TaxID=1820333 RepID=A0A6L6JE00_9RHOB|nr:zinc-binding dehydrogenase [Paracoccus aestuariivivens]MTH78131.1 zinc-binding dehydrogenase [Paracoccus aestuariivivens]
MRSAIHSAFGEPDQVLTPGESPLPEPAEGQVRIKTILSPIHNHDLVTVQGLYGYKPDLPAIGGTEAVGTIDAIGPGVEGVTLGQRIAVAAVHGTWAEYFLAPAASLVPLPDAIADEQAAQLIAMPFSALTLLEFLGLQEGDWIVQNAANGAVGKAVAMLGAARGINVVSIVRREATITEMAELGITNVVSTDTTGWQDRVRALTGGARVKAGVDSIGGKASGDLLSLLGDDSTLVSFGSLTGEPMILDAGQLIYKQAVVKGYWAAKVAAALGREGMGRLVAELMGLVIEGKVRLPVEGIFGFDQIQHAVTASLTPGKAGKVLLRP